MDGKVIGITQRTSLLNDVEHDALDRNFYKLFNAHVLLPIPTVPLDVSGIADKIDILVISGGDSNSQRVENELLLYNEMIKRGKPIVGICHGAILLTMILKGKVLATNKHHNTKHLVEYRNKKIEVNSFHKSLITKIPGYVQILCTAVSDKSIEAWINGNIGAVMWHPERMEKPFIPDEIKELLAI